MSAKLTASTRRSCQQPWVFNPREPQAPAQHEIVLLEMAQWAGASSSKHMARFHPKIPLQKHPPWRNHPGRRVRFAHCGRGRAEHARAAGQSPASVCRLGKQQSCCRGGRALHKLLQRMLPTSTCMWAFLVARSSLLQTKVSPLSRT